MKVDQGFLPILGEAPEVLILGTMPSVRSLQDQQYYAHPQNAFWWIMSELFGFDFQLPYDTRASLLKQNKVAVWDVIQSCYRKGSLDAAIDQSSLTANNFNVFLTENSSIQLIAFNGQAAYKLFKKHVSTKLFSVDYIVLPSTSPANAAMKRQVKLEHWLSIKV